MEILKSATRITLLLVIMAIIWLNAFQIDISETLKSIALMIVSFYFWQKTLDNNKK